MITQEFDIMEPLSVYVKSIEDFIYVTELAGVPCIDAQMSNKLFTKLLK